MLGRRTTADAGPADGAALLAAHGRWLRTVLLVRSGERTAVDELFQELAVVVIRKPPAHVLSDKQPAWLYGLAVRLALLYRRKRGRQRRLQQQFGDQGGDRPATPLDPLAWLLADERQQLVRQSLLRMTPKDRELLVLKYTEDWSYRDLAARLGVTESAVEARLHRARARLRSELAVFQLLESTR